MTRRLTAEERDLWERLGRSVEPLRRERRRPDRPAPAAMARDQPVEPEAPLPAMPKPAHRPEQPLATLEPRTRRRLARGLVEVDARIDLHGMRQERAHAALLAFLRHAQARGARIVLVVTGKGGEGGDGRGVLRRMVPAWLGRTDLRHLVVGFDEAARRHGGAGALYVRLRRRGRVPPGEAPS
jgi:DNA-nicking Smr family endonuclease